jgi:hypothetical protein
LNLKQGKVDFPSPLTIEALSNGNLLNKLMGVLTGQSTPKVCTRIDAWACLCRDLWFCAIH